MFKAISPYDGSDTSKCISLTVGDTLSEVHALDETWFIGFNERTKETGAFPISCVEAIASNDYSPVPAKRGNVSAKDDVKIYANVAGHIRDLGSSVGNDLDPVTRTRTLSSHAKSFDTARLRANKQGYGENESDGDTDVLDDTPHYESANKKSVHFDGNQLQHSISVPESMLSWQDSSFEHSLDDVTNDKTVGEKIKAEFDVMEANTDGKYHKLKREKLRALKSSTERIFNSAKNEKKGLKALFGAIAGFVIGALLFLVLVFSFDYSYLVAGIIDAVATIFFILCLAFCPLCRCIMALVFPNFFTGKGRAVFLSIIFGVMLSHPIANINRNIQETSKSLACVTELAANQTIALQKQLAQPVSEVTDYVADQKTKLAQISDSMKVAFGGIGTALDEVDKQVDDAKRTLINVKDACRKPFNDAYNECVNTCNSVLTLLSEVCIRACSEIKNVASVCDTVDETGKFITDSAKKTRAEVEKAVQYFDVDLEVSSEFSASVNESKSIDSIQDEVKKDVSVVFDRFKNFIFVVKVILSLSLALIFFQSFWYLRNYLAKDAYDNVYITSKFKELDKENSNKGLEAILPLKKKERSVYVDTSSFKLNSGELAHCRLGLAQVFLHFVLCLMVLLFDYSLWFILILIKTNGDIQVEFEGQGRFTVKVTGNGPVSDFYKIMVQGFNLDQTYNSSLDVRKCLPDPGKPSIAIIPALLILYLISLAFVVLRGYGMRLRRKIAAYYYPEQEIMRLEYLHKKIRHKRVGFLKFLRQQIKSARKENDVKEKFRISTWLAFQFPVLESCLPSRDKLECTSCEQKESSFNGVILAKCPGEVGGMPCDAVYCQECRFQLSNICPLCSTNDVVLRD